MSKLRMWMGAGLLAAAFQAQAVFVTIDFDSLTAGDVVTNQFAAGGVEFELAGGGGPTVQSINPATYGNIPSGPLALVPGDDLLDPFADITINFSVDIDFFSLDAFDADEPMVVTAFKNNAVVQAQPFAAGTNLQHYDIIFSGIGTFDRVVIDVTEGAAGGNLGGPEFFDNLAYNTVSEPGVVLLFGLGLVGLAGSSRRRA